MEGIEHIYNIEEKILTSVGSYSIDNNFHPGMSNSERAFLLGRIDGLYEALYILRTELCDESE